MLHGDQVVELSVLLGVHQEGEVEEDGEGQVEVEREEGEVKERRSWMRWDEVRLKNTLSHEVHVTRHQEVYNEDCALYVLCSQVQLARVGVRVLVLVDVVCVMLVLIARVDNSCCKYTVFVAIFCSWRCTLYTPVGDSELR